MRHLSLTTLTTRSNQGFHEHTTLTTVANPGGPRGPCPLPSKIGIRDPCYVKTEESSDKMLRTVRIEPTKGGRIDFMFLGPPTRPLDPMLDNNANIGNRGFTTWKQSSGKMLPPVRIKPLIQSPAKFLQNSVARLDFWENVLSFYLLLH